MLKPRGDRIVVEPIERTASSIIVTVLRERPNIGTIVATGAGTFDKHGRLKPLEVQPGQTIRYGEFDFPTYTDPASLKRYLIMQEADVAGIVEN